MDRKDPNTLSGLRPPRPKRPPMPVAHGIQLYLDLFGWMVWMVIVGFFSLRAAERPFLVNLGLAGVIGVLTFVNLFGFWLVMGRWQVRRKAASAGGDAKIEREEVEGETASSTPAAPGEGPAAQRERPEGGISRPPPGEPRRLRRQVTWLGVVAAAVAGAILATGAAGRPLFLPGTGTVKGAVALVLALWIFMEPIHREGGPGFRRGVWAVRTGLGLALMCFASDLYFPWFGAAGVAAGGAAAAWGKRGGGLYATILSGAAWAFQWWGATLQ